jgi:hypothetical protein
MARTQETDASNFLSLAIDKNGVLRGSYYNAVSDENSHVTGKVDKKTQRAAWTIGDKKEPVYEAGISNLTKDQLTILVHKAGGKVEQMLLVRVKQGVPGTGTGAGGGNGGAKAAASTTGQRQQGNPAGDDPIRVNAPPENDPTEQ